MTEAPDQDASPHAAASIEQLARDWLTIWESELASLWADREGHEFLARLFAAWSNVVTPRQNGLRRERDQHPGPAAATRAAPASSPPDARDAAFGKLDRRLAAIEERLAALESELRRSDGPDDGHVRNPDRPPRRGRVAPRRTR